MNLWIRKAPAFFTSIVLLFIFVGAYLFHLYPSKDLEGGIFKIEEVKRNVTSIQTTITYIGKLNHIPCRITFRPNQNRPIANKDYLIEKGAFHKNTFKPLSEWKPIENSWSLAEWRFQTKEKVKRFVFSRFKNPKVASLFAGLATGNMENPLLSYHFGAIGLAHLLAISGFHFALLTFFLAFFLKRFLPEKLFAISLIALLGLYFFYMGGAPSISRAWIGVLLYLVGILFGYRTNPLNALGVALLFALISDPFVITNIGFQLSFGATLGIILFYSLFEEKLTSFLPKRPYKILLEMKAKDQLGYLLCAYIRKGLALQGSVLVFTFPLILYHFETFPLISLFYNLFVPFFFALLLALFLLQLDFLASPLASFLITMVEGAPRPLLFKVNASQSLLLIGGIFLLFIYRRVLRSKKQSVKHCKS
ncbi:MAG: ComEC/Rec2 family competence protein [Chlamydiia bacterium]|nr:ComEC/Rec2 family competence protein [Chlamydiia bacterium]